MLNKSVYVPGILKHKRKSEFQKHGLCNVEMWPYCFFFSLWRILSISRGFPCGSAGKKSTCNVGDLGLIPGLGRSPGKGKGYPLQYSGLETCMNCILHGITESDTTEWLSHTHTHTHTLPLKCPFQFPLVECIEIILAGIYTGKIVVVKLVFVEQMNR